MMSMTALELRKSRLVFIGLAAAFALSLPLGAWIGNRSLFSAMTGVHAALAFWCTLGLPALAVLLGASAGAGLRAESVSEAEALLPVSPRARVFSALSSALIHMALLAGLALTVSFLLGPWLSVDKDWGRLSWDLFDSIGLYLSLLSFALVFMLGSGLLFAYLFGHGILGGLLGAGLGAAAAASVGAAFILRQFFPESVGWDRLPEAGMIAAACLVLAALRSAAPAVERRPARGWAASAGAILLSAAAAAVCAGAFLHMRERAAHAREIVKPRFLGDWSAARRIDLQARGVFLADREGTVTAVTPDGAESVVVPGEERPLKHLLDWPHWFPNRSMAWTPEGVLWVLRRTATRPLNGWELIGAKPGEGSMTRVALAGERMDLSLDWREGRLVLMGTVYGQPDGKWSYRYAPVPAPGEEPRWSPVPASWGAERRASELPLMRLNSDLSRYSTRRGFFRALRGEISPLRFASPKGTLVPVKLKDGVRALAEYRRDGAVRHHWRGAIGKDFSPRMLPDGTLWCWGAGDRLLMLSPEGTPLEPLDLAKTFSALRQEDPAIMAHPFLIHRGSGSLWLFTLSELFQIEESSGSLLKRVKLPKRALSRRDDRSDFHVAEGGLFHHDGRSLYFMDWEGRLRRLGKA